MGDTRAAIILAGGEGTRLRALTRLVAGDDRPKQFCAVVGRETLLDQTQRRTVRLVDPERTRIVVTQAHERYYAPLLKSAGTASVVVQPESRGTAPAILYGLLHLPAGTDAVAVFPSDHHIAAEDLFLVRVEGAFQAVQARPGMVVLLGIEPDRPEIEYGWIEPGELVLGAWPWPLYRIRRFWEKPAPATAERLLRQGCLWNSFVIVAHPATLEDLIAQADAVLHQELVLLRPGPERNGEPGLAREVYSRIPATDFSKRVLQARPERLAVLPAGPMGWNDLGTPTRVRATRQSLRWQAVPA